MHRAMLALVLLAPMASNAIPVNYDEATDGDIVSFDTTFDLDIGTNTVAGTICNTLDCFDDDFFSIVIPLGGVLQEVTVSLTDGAGGNGTFAVQFNWIGSVSGFNAVMTSGFFSPDMGNDPSYSFVGLNGFDPGMVNDYVITFDVAAVAVPEPASFTLLGLGLASIAATRRRKAQ